MVYGKLFRIIDYLQNFIQKVGFPSLMALLLFWFIVQEVRHLTTVIENNTQALTEIRLALKETKICQKENAAFGETYLVK